MNLSRKQPENHAVAAALARVRAQVTHALAQAGRPAGTVTLIAVSKTFPARDMAAAALCGQRHFGESYVQEALPKMAEVQSLLAADDTELPGAANRLVWHFIGPIQSNKTREMAGHFDWVHGVDREKIAQRLSSQRPAHLAPLNICLQVNISGEPGKSGVAPETVFDLASAVAGLPGIKLRGLMTIPAASSDPAPAFRRMLELKDELNARGLALDTLSMGMSEDFETAIANGATMIRVGSAIFGKRSYA